jgi:hypothetical protein
LGRRLREPRLEFEARSDNKQNSAWATKEPDGHSAIAVSESGYPIAPAINRLPIATNHPMSVTLATRFRLSDYFWIVYGFVLGVKAEQRRQK